MAEKYKLLRIDANGETEIAAFEAPDVRTACKKHVEAWKNKKTSHAVVLVFQNGFRHSYRDSVELLAAP